MSKEAKTWPKEEIQQNFLWYEEFKISKYDALKEPGKALKKCIKRAYRDLSRTLKFTHSTDELKEMRKKGKKDRDKWDQYEQYINCKDSWRDGCEEVLQRKIEELQEKIKQLDERESIERNHFDGWHEKLCGKLVGRSQGVKAKTNEPLFKEDFTFGHAQKWVNMTLKYMLIMEIFDWKMQKLVSCLHVPIDKYVLKRAYEQFFKESKMLEKLIEKTGRDDSQWFVRDTDQGDKGPKWTWSQIPTYKCYKDFQIEIRKVLDGTKYPIIWESSAWREAAAEDDKSETVAAENGESEINEA